MAKTSLRTVYPQERKLDLITITPEIAMELLEYNRLNRPLNQVHVHRIAQQILEDKWKFNGDTIKIAANGDVLDGQHRLWAIIEAKKPVESVIVYGVEKEAFATIDTLRKPRSGADILALKGLEQYRTPTSTALSWLIRYQRQTLLDYRAPKNRIENSDIEDAFEHHPKMVSAIQRATRLRKLVNPGVLGFLYYLFTNHNPEIAEQMMATLEDASRVGTSDPFFQLRYWLTSLRTGPRDPVMIIALAIKAANLAVEGRKINKLTWRSQGKQSEEFPKLRIAATRAVA